VKALRKKDRPLEDHLQNIFEVLREKEMELERVRQEVETLRLACPLLLDESDSRTFVVSMQQEEGNITVRPADEVATSSEPIRIQLVAAPKPDAINEKDVEKSVLLKVRHAALGVSHKVLKRVRDSRLLASEFQRKTVRDLFERFSDAA
jgi:hypothetical protein